MMRLILILAATLLPNVSFSTKLCDSNGTVLEIGDVILTTSGGVYEVSDFRTGNQIMRISGNRDYGFLERIFSGGMKGIGKSLLVERSEYDPNFELYPGDTLRDYSSRSHKFLKRYPNAIVKSIGQSYQVVVKKILPDLYFTARKQSKFRKKEDLGVIEFISPLNSEYVTPHFRTLRATDKVNNLAIGDKIQTTGFKQDEFSRNGSLTRGFVLTKEKRSINIVCESQLTIPMSIPISIRIGKHFLHGLYVGLSGHQDGFNHEFMMIGKTPSVRGKTAEIFPESFNPDGIFSGTIRYLAPDGGIAVLQEDTSGQLLSISPQAFSYANSASE